MLGRQGLLHRLQYDIPLLFVTLPSMEVHIMKIFDSLTTAAATCMCLQMFPESSNCHSLSPSLPQCSYTAATTATTPLLRRIEIMCISCILCHVDKRGKLIQLLSPCQTHSHSRSSSSSHSTLKSRREPLTFQWLPFLSSTAVVLK